MDKKLLLLGLIILLLMIVTNVAFAAEVVLDGFETGSYFEKSENILAANLSTDHATQGNNSLKIIYGDISTSGKAFSQNTKTKGWAGATAIKLDIYNDSDNAFNFAMSISTGDNWNWNESKTISVKRGTNTITLPLTPENWKNNGSGWQMRAEVDLSNVKGYGLLIYPAGMALPSNAIYVDNIRLVKEDAEEKVVELESVKDHFKKEKTTPKSSFLSKFNVSGNVEVITTSENVPAGKKLINGIIDWTSTNGEIDKLAVDTGEFSSVSEYIHVKNNTDGKFNINLATDTIDFDKYSGFRLKVYKPVGKDITIKPYVQHGSDWKWSDVGDIDVEAGSWQIIRINKSDYDDVDWNNIKQFGFEIGSDYDGSGLYIADVLAIEEDSYGGTETTVEREIELNIAYKHNQNWEVNSTINISDKGLNDPIIDLGETEVIGNIDGTKIRTFYKDTAEDTGETMKLFAGSEYDDAAGIEVNTLVGLNSIHTAVIAPIKVNEDGDIPWSMNEIEFDMPLILSEVSMPVGDYSTIKAGGILQSDTDNNEDATAFVNVEHSFVSGLSLTGEVAVSDGIFEKEKEKSDSKFESMGWYVKAEQSLGSLYWQLESKRYGGNLFKNYADIDHKNKLEYEGKNYAKAEYTFSENAKTGLEFNNSFNGLYKAEKEEYLNDWNELSPKLYFDGKLLPKLGIYASLEGKWANKSYWGIEDYYLDYEKAYIKATPSLDIENLTGNIEFWLESDKDPVEGSEDEIKEHFQKPNFKFNLGYQISEALKTDINLWLESSSNENTFDKPALRTRANYQVVDGFDITGEYTVSREDKDADFKQNFYANINKELSAGNLEFIYGKEVLDDDNELSNRKTLDKYQVKYTVSF
jgi:hypothetical protein